MEGFLAAPGVDGLDKSRTVSTASVHIPRAAIDVSMIGDCAPPMMEGDSVMDFDAPPSGHHSTSARNQRVELAVDKAVSHPATEPYSSKPQILGRLDRSTLLPSFNDHTTSHLMQSTQALSREAPPWKERQKVSDTPRKGHDLPLITPPKLPTSSSGQSLSSAGENSELQTSTILPVSAKRSRYLLADDHQLDKEILAYEDESMIAALPSRFGVTPGKTSVKMRSPIPSLRPREADMTLDMRALMANMAKPKRPSGMEESFVDLLHGDLGMEDLNMSVLGGDDSFLPANLRPKWDLRADMSMPSPRKTPKATKTTPAESGGDLFQATPATISKSARRRSRSLTDERPPITTSVKRVAQVSPRKVDPLTPSLQRSRTGMGPTGSRRVSLSAGALPMPMSASHRVMHLPSATPATVSRTKSIDRRQARPVSQDTPTAPSTTKRSLPASASSRNLAPPVDEFGVKVTPSLTRTESTRSRTAVSTQTRVETVRARVDSIKSTIPSRVRTQSTSATTVASARTGSTPAATTISAQRTLSRPTSMIRPAREGRVVPVSQSPPKPVLSAETRMRPPTSTLPSRGSRIFGTDGFTLTNRTSTITTTTKRSTSPSKMSVDPSALTSRMRREEPSSLKSRAMSTPAIATTNQARPAIAARRTVVEPTRLPAIPGSSSGGVRAPASGLPRAGAARVPGAKTSITTNPVADLRARLDRLQLRQQRPK